MEDATELRQSIKDVREGKEMAKTFEVVMSGPADKKLEQITDNANFILSDLENKHEHFITDKYIELESYIGLSYDEIREHHAKGFNKFLKQQYRLFRKEQPKNLEQFNDNNYIKDLATGYTFDYIRTLTLGKKMEVPAGVALQLAEDSYWNNPNILISLAHQFPDADPGLINRAATSNPTNPEAFIQKVMDSILRLQEQFPDVDPSLIRLAATKNPTSPEVFIQKVLDSIPRLQKKFPNADPNLINRAATSNPTNPEAFIQKVMEKIPRLQEQFPNADLGLIKYAATGYPTNPEAFIQKVMDSISRLQEQFIDANPSLIKHAAISYPTNPEAFIQKVMDSIPRLQEQFPDVDLNIIKHTAIHNPNNPEAFIKEYNQRLKELQNKFKDSAFSPLLKKAAIYKDCETVLQRLLRGENIEEAEDDLEDESIDELWSEEE